MKRIVYTESLAKRIQAWGEQDPRIGNAEMKRWRKVWNARTRLEEPHNVLPEGGKCPHMGADGCNWRRGLPCNK